MLRGLITLVDRVVLRSFQESEEFGAVFAAAADVESAICERGPLRLKSVVLTSGIIVYQVVSRWTFQEASSDRRRRDLHQLYHTSG